MVLACVFHSYLAFESFAKGEQRSVDRVFDLEVVVVALNS